MAASQSNTTGSDASVEYSSVEVWDGLINAWPERPEDTSLPLLWDGPLPNDNWNVGWVGF